MMTKQDYTKLINSIEEAIEYKNTNMILLNLDDWYIVRHNKSISDAFSFGYHRGCDMDLQCAPFLHWKALKCRGCGELPPDGIAGLYALHNMEHIQKEHTDADRI